MNADPASMPAGRAFLGLMRRYVVDYTNRHDQSATATIMEPDYTLRMGEHVLTGRDGPYAQATRRQLEQFPDLHLTVHEIVTSGERLVMHFSEHGASVRHGGARAAWSGIGLYRWNGSRLTANNVEQDYHSRAEQLACGTANPLEPEADAPWDGTSAPPEETAERLVRGWLDSGALAATPGVACDDGWTGVAVPRIVEQSRVTINDLFSCGPVVAFHVTQHGTLTADFAGTPDEVGRQVSLTMAGIVHTSGAGIERGRIIRNRLDLRRELDRWR